MADPSIAAVDTELLVEHFYRELADERAASARRLLSSEPPERSLARSAQWFELAAAALRHVITLAPADEETGERLADQAEALTVMAARFEQSADIARRAARSAPATDRGTQNKESGAGGNGRRHSDESGRSL